MKTRIVITLIIACFFLNGYSRINEEELPVEIQLTLFIVNKQNQGVNNPKSPDLVVSILEHTLFFDNVSEELDLIMYDGNGIAVYSTSIDATTNTQVLPTNLSGIYEICLSTSDFYYLGYIDL